MTFDLESVLSGFLVGVATGAAGTYFANKYTDRRREKEIVRQAKKQFLAINEQMSKLIDEMRSNLVGEGNASIREFFILANKQSCLGRSEKHRFIYYEDEHDNLRGKLDILENVGYILDVTPGNTPIYRMTEEFAEFLIRIK